jgi:uncharacterized protein YjbI with pentapeptide repeats
MKASEIREKYAAGERNFHRVNLRGQSFKGEDLSGADFTEAEIQGTNFSNANLKGANFTSAKAGIQRYCKTSFCNAKWLYCLEITCRGSTVQLDP